MKVLKRSQKEYECPVCGSMLRITDKCDVHYGTYDHGHGNKGTPISWTGFYITCPVCGKFIPLKEY